ncbi:hypothetical protein ABPG75_010237 [Micractinium tetrahymenae]
MGEPAEHATNAAAGAAVVSESLEGLVSAVDELKKSLGLGEQGVDLSAVEQYVARLRQENEEFQQFAEEAIVSAQRLRAERDDLQARLEQVSLEATMGAALKETQKLKDVADEFERDLYQQKLAEAEARMAEAEALRERVAELEEENAGLTQTLNEFRQTTHQLQKLQSHELRRLQAVEKGGGSGAGSAGSGTPTCPGSVSGAPADAAPQQNGTGPASAGSSPRAASGAGAATPRRSRRGSAAGGAAAAAAVVAAAEVSAEAAEATRIAEQLEDVAGGAESGLLADAAVALRELSRRDAELVTMQQENARLRAEVEELNDTMFSKTFKPPSAWAEREIKYKSEKKQWEEQHKELAARLAALSSEVEAYRGTSKTQQLEDRIQDLEARLLQSEREKDSVRAQLHEVQLSMRTEGEFGNAGKRLSPYKGPLGVLATEGHEVQQLVDNLEHASAGTASPEVLGTSAAAQRLQGLAAQLQAAATENQALRRQLAEQQLVKVPPSLHVELGPVATAGAVAAAAVGIEARLQRAEATSAELRQRLGLPAAASPAVGSPVQGGPAEPAATAAEQQAAQLSARAEAAQAAGQESEAERLRSQASQLEALAAQLRQAESERKALARALQELQPVRLQISTVAAPVAGGDDEAAAPGSGAADKLVAVPAALQQELGGPVAQASAVEAKGAELEARLDEAGQQAAELRQQLRTAVAVGRVAAAAEAAEQQAAARLDAATLASAGQPGEDSEEVLSLQQQLATARQQKEAAQAQLWQLQELQEQLQASAAERRRLSAQLVAAQPVSLQLAVSGEAAQQAQQAEAADVAELRSQLAEVQRHSAELLSQVDALAAAAKTADLGMHLALQVGGGDAGSSEAAEQLAAAEAEAACLRHQLEDLQPVRLQLALGSPEAAGGARRSLADAMGGQPPIEASPSDLPLLAAEPSDVGAMTALLYSSEHANALTAERQAADAALREYQKNTDVPSLLRAKAELETRCQMLESQIAKMQGDLAHADEANAEFEHHLNSALNTGDVSVLSGLKERLAAGRQSLSKRMFKRQVKGHSPSKGELKTTVHEMQDQLMSSEEEKNALKRQLAKLTKKYQQVQQQAAHAAGIMAGAQAMARTSTDESSPEVSLSGVLDEDGELELMKMREENQMLMEHVVMVKVRQAEMEGEYLEAKRQLLRSREKNLQLARKLQDIKEAAEKGEALPLTPKSGAGAGAAAAASPPAMPLAEAITPQSETKKRGSFRLPGL